MKRYIISLLLISFQGLLSQVQFEARVSKTSLGLNERLRIDFIMNIDGDNFVQPNFEGFKVIAGPSQQVSQSWINGKSSFEKIYSYFLMPTQKGTFIIKQATIEFNDQVYKTAPIKINVTAPVQQQYDSNDPDAPQVAVDDNIYLVADISNTNPYINEPITVVYKLYFSYNIGITNWKELNKPKYNDFWSQNIDIKQLVPEEGMFRGQRYRYVVLKKAVLFPQKSGKLKIEPLSLDIDVQMPTNRRDIFGRVFVTEGNKRVSAGSKVISVKPFPEAGKPNDFSGAVGSFTFDVTPTKKNIKSGESLDLIVSVSGKGNMKLFDLPKPVAPNALEMYDAIHKEQVNTTLSGMSGKISDTYTIVPQYKGEYAIKPMSFTYFDLNTGRYKTLWSKEIMIAVQEDAIASNGAKTNPTADKRQPNYSEQFRYIQLDTELQSVKKEDFLGSTLYYSLLLLPFLALPLIVFLRNQKEARKGDFVSNRIRMNNRLAKKYLAEAKKQLQNKEAFYVALEKALHNFLKAKLHIETSEMSKDNIKELLLSRKCTPEIVQQFMRLIENCEFARYAQSSDSAIQNDFDQAVAIISELEKQI